MIAIKRGSNFKKRNTARELFIFFLICLAIGFILGELLGAYLVARGNKCLLAEQEWLEGKGYIAVPGTIQGAEIKSVKTYLKGGLFFALSIGLCYAFLWGLILWIFGKYRILQLIMTALILILISYYYLKHPGLATHWPFGIFLFLTPLIIFIIIHITHIIKPAQREHYACSVMRGISYALCLIGIFIITYRLFAPTLNVSDFIWIRDGLFGRTDWGIKINEFYYHYTLYPARVIQDFNQRLQKGLRIDPNGFSGHEINILQNHLSWQNIFIGDDFPSGSVIKRVKDTDRVLITSSSPKFSIETTLDALNKDPEPIFEEYNTKSNWAILLREWIRISLFNIWPIMGILFIFSFTLFILSLIFSYPSPSRDATITFLLIILLILVLRALIKPAELIKSDKDILTCLKSTQYDHKIRAVMAISDKIEKSEINLPEYQEYFLDMLNDPNPIIKRWGIDFLTKAKAKKSIKSILVLLDDKDPLVAFHTARAMGKLRVYEAREPLLRIIKGDREWYLKNTAYIALQEIGWRQ